MATPAEQFPANEQGRFVIDPKTGKLSGESLEMRPPEPEERGAPPDEVVVLDRPMSDLLKKTVEKKKGGAAAEPHPAEYVDTLQWLVERRAHLFRQMENLKEKGDEQSNEDLADAKEEFAKTEKRIGRINEALQKRRGEIEALYEERETGN